MTRLSSSVFRHINNNRVRQTAGTSTTNFTLDVPAGLTEVISTTNGTAYLHLPGLVMAQNSAGQRVYLLSDGLGSIRQVISGSEVIAWRDYDPYGQARQSDPLTDTFTSSLADWSTTWVQNAASVTNPPGVMRLASTKTPPYPQIVGVMFKKRGLDHQQP